MVSVGVNGRYLLNLKLPVVVMYYWIVSSDFMTSDRWPLSCMRRCWLNDSTSTYRIGLMNISLSHQHSVTTAVPWSSDSLAPSCNAVVSVLVSVTLPYHIKWYFFLYPSDPLGYWYILWFDSCWFKERKLERMFGLGPVSLLVTQMLYWGGLGHFELKLLLIIGPLQLLGAKTFHTVLGLCGGIGGL